MPDESPHSDSGIRRLTEAMTQGDEAAYRDFFAEYFDRILRYLLVLSGGKSEAAREAVQRTMSRVVRHVRPFDSEEIFWSWLTVLARSAWTDEQRRLGRYLHFLDRFRRYQIDEAAARCDHQTDRHLWELLESQIRLLPEEEQALIQRKYLDGQATAKIADLSHTTEKAVESRLGRIRQKLKLLVLQQLNHEKARR
jgi:RNA polymerase sigma factor (sigma-70 family)